MDILITRNTSINSIVVDVIDENKQISILIPSFEYKEWLRVNDRVNNKETLEIFVNEYLKGIITADDTAEIIIKSILKLRDASVPYTIAFIDKTYIIKKNSFGYDMYEVIGEKHSRISSEEILAVYTFLTTHNNYSNN